MKNRTIWSGVLPGRAPVDHRCRRAERGGSLGEPVDDLDDTHAEHDGSCDHHQGGDCFRVLGNEEAGLGDQARFVVGAQRAEHLTLPNRVLGRGEQDCRAEHCEHDHDRH